jgi:hypothetical protein
MRPEGKQSFGGDGQHLSTLYPNRKGLQRSCRRIHTPTMTLKNAALLALFGMILLTILLAVSFVVSLTGFLGSVVPAMSLLASLIRLFAALSLVVFFYAFHKAQG